MQTDASSADDVKPASTEKTEVVAAEYRLRPRHLASYEPTWSARHAHLTNGERAPDMGSIFYDGKTGASSSIDCRLIDR